MVLDDEASNPAPGSIEALFDQGFGDFDNEDHHTDCISGGQSSTITKPVPTVPA